MNNDLLGLFQEMDEDYGTREQYIRAPFGYPGSKMKSISQIIPHLPYRQSYIEPFGGSAAVMLNRQPCDLEVFNDRYAGVVSFYRCVRDKNMCERLINRLELCLHSREEFLWCKETWEKLDEDVERAARWYYMTQMSFGNKAEAFGRATHCKSQFGDKLKNNLKLFWSIHSRMRAVQIENLDWRDCILDFDGPDAVFYLDPPYLECNKRIYTHEITNYDHREMLAMIKNMQGFVALSGYDNDIYNSALDWDNKIQWPVKMTMVQMGEGAQNKRTERHEVLETLWIKEEL